MGKFKRQRSKADFQSNLRAIILVLIDIFILFLAYLVTGIVYKVNVYNYLWDVALMGGVFVIVFWLNGLGMAMWRYASFEELNKLIWSSVTVATLYVGTAYIFWPSYTHFVFTMLFATAYAIGLITSRLIYCMYYQYRKLNVIGVKKKVAIIGGGYMCASVLRSIAIAQGVTYEVVGIFDDDPQKLNRRLNGVKVIGTLDDIPEAARLLKIDDLIIAISAMSKKCKERVYALCEKTDCQIKKVPSIEEIMKSEDVGSTIKLESIKIEDLLGRDIINLSDDEVKSGIRDKVVLVTGGGGSIGSELCRQIASCEVLQLIILDIYENNAYDIQQELKRKYGDNLNLKVEIASVRDEAKVDQIMAKYRPHIVYHAAAHKHVPLMETNPEEAIKNNIFGTYNVVMAAHRNNVEKFVFISTDKAVNPTNVMGATKRFCEMIVQSMKGFSKTTFAAVRFGNVLGSNGSVIPLFKKQIETGGPVTVTHPDIIRYFMVIPEAVKLVLTAGATAENGTVFVLDMGKPVRIADLAKRMIRLAGFVPDRDIMVEYTGLRPGEKMYEELLVKNENTTKTQHDKIFVENLDDVAYNYVEKSLNKFRDAIKSRDRMRIIDTLQTYVTTYVPTPNSEVTITRTGEKIVK